MADLDDVVMEGDRVLDRGRNEIVLRPEGPKEIIERNPEFPAGPEELGIVIGAGSAIHGDGVLCCGNRR